jgi:hypothetical protein
LREERVARLLDAVLAVTGDTELERVLTRVVEAACGMVGARYGALGVLADDGQGLSEFVHTGLEDAVVARIGRLPEGRGILGVLIAHPEPLRLDDLKDHPASFGFPPNHPPMHAFLGAPIRVRDEVFGNLYLTEKVGGGGFTAEDEEMVIGLAAVAGAAISNARLIDDLRRREAWRSAVLEVTTSVLSGEAADLARHPRERGGARPRRRVRRRHRGRPGGPDPHHRLGRRGAAARPTDRDTPVDEVLTEGVAIRVPRSLLFPHAAAWVPLHERDEVVAALGVGRPSRSDGGRPRAAPAVRVAGEPGARARPGVLRPAPARADRGPRAHRPGPARHRDPAAVRHRAQPAGARPTGRRPPEVAEKLARAVDDVDATVKEIRSTIFALQAPPEVASVRGDVLRVTDEIATMLPSAPRVRFDGPIDTVVTAASWPTTSCRWSARR